MIYLPNGIGEVLGDPLVTTSPLQLTGNVWYVRSTNGVDAVSPAGKDKEKPLATLAQAQTNASDNDIIVCLSGHTETYTVALSISKKLVIVGSGTVFGKPGATFKINAAAADVFDIATDHVELRNLYFPESVQLNSGANNGKVYVNSTDCFITGCYFECGANDNLAAVVADTSCNRLLVSGCTFISTAIAVATRPKAGIRLSVAASDVRIEDTVFSDGTVGFQEEGIHTSAFVQTRFVGEGLSFLLGADATFNSSSTGRLNVATATGGGRVSW